MLLVSGSLEQMQHSMLTLNSVAELRRAKETAEFFDSLRPEEQQQWLDEVLARTQFPADTDEAPRVCHLDTGVNRGHRFLGPAVDPADLHSVRPGWGTDDVHGHGTQMAGAARYALIVSIRAPEVDVDLRTEVANQIGVAVAIET